jgi:hypothetical protein
MQQDLLATVLARDQTFQVFTTCTTSASIWLWASWKIVQHTLQVTESSQFPLRILIKLRHHDDYMSSGFTHSRRTPLSSTPMAPSSEMGGLAVDGLFSGKTLNFSNSVKAAAIWGKERQYSMLNFMLYMKPPPHYLPLSYAV